MIRPLLCVGAALALYASLDAHDFRLRDESVTRHTLRFAGAGERSLTLRNTNGSIRVTAGADDSVQLDVRRVAWADTSADLKAAMDKTITIADGRPNLEAVVLDGNGASCGEGRGTRDPRRSWGDEPFAVSYHLTATVPAGTRLVLCTINGPAEVIGTTGDFDVRSVNGRVRMTDVRGSGDAATVNGSVSATFVNVPTRDSRFKTVNGSVTVAWPPTLSARLRLKTLNGGLFTDFDAQPQVRPAQTGSRRDGRWTYKSDRTADIQIGQGGPLVQLESVNGSIRVLRTDNR